MSRGALLTGIAGGIVGSITGIIGIIWIMVSTKLAIDIYNYIQLVMGLSAFYGIHIFALTPLPNSIFQFITLSIVFAGFLIMSGILIGVGFHGLYKAGGGTMGRVGFVSGIMGTATGSLFILLGNVITSTKVMYLFLVSIFIGFTGILPVPLSTPNLFVVGIGMIALAVTFFTLGVSSIVVRETTINSAASAAAGVLSIVGACLLILYTLVQYEASSLALLGGIMSFIGFALIFVAFILWTVVFTSSRDILPIKRI